MGVCHSSCVNTSSLELYDAWRHQPIRRPFKASDYNKGEIKLGVCKCGCCSVRRKLDYAEYQSYCKYVEVSPYVVLQDKTRLCDCVMCCGIAHVEMRENGPLTLSNSLNDERLENSATQEAIGLRTH